MQNEELQRAQQELEASRQEYSDLFHSAPIPFLLLDKNLLIKKANQAALNLLKVGLLPSPFLVCVTRRHRRKYRDFFESLKKEAKGGVCALELLSSSKGEVHALVNASPVKNNENAITGWYLSITDSAFPLENCKQAEKDLIKSRKQIEVLATLRESESLYRAIARNFPDGAVYVFDRDLRFRVADGKALATLGYTSEGLEGKTIWEATDPETCRILEERYPRVLAGESLHFETSLKNHVFSSAYVPIRDQQGNIIAGLVVAHDITERKRAEEELRQSEQRFRAIYEHVGIGIAFGDLQGRLTFVNPTFEKMLGYEEGELIGRNFRDLTLEKDLPSENVYINELFAGKRDHYSIEKRYLRKDGEAIWIELFASLLNDSNGKPSSGLAIVQEITERKRTEHKLVEQAFLLANVGDAVVGFDLDFRITFWGAAAERMYGYTAVETVGRPGIEILKPIYVGITREEALARLMNSGRLEVDFIQETKDGRKLNIESYSMLLRDDKGEPCGIVGVNRDITERKRAEEALAQAHALTETILTTAPVGFVYFDRNLRYTLINERLAEINGLPVSEHIGKRVHDIVPTLAPLAEQIAAQILATGRPVKDHEFSGETAMAPGVTRYWNESWYPVHDTQGVIVGFGAVVEEITARKQAEEELRDRESRYRQLALRLEQVREEERAALARELHDDLGQVLAGLGFDLAWIKKRISSHDEEVKLKVENIREYVRTALQRLRMVYTNLRPGLLDEMGLLAAIESYVSSFQEKSGIITILESHLDEKILNADQITTLFRIIQESLTNIFKHAKASEANVSLFQKNGEVVLRVADNGKGIRKPDLKKRHSFGLAGIDERIKKLGGEFNIQGTPGKGTLLTVSIPVSNSPS